MSRAAAQTYCTALGLALVLSAAARAANEGFVPCARTTFESRAYVVCRAPLQKFTIRLFWRRPDGSPYTYLNALPKIDDRGGRLAFALNGGMYDPDYKPVGLYVEDGQQLVEANTRSGPGNFHLKPNGVFYVGEGGAGVLETGAYLKERPRAVYATQSGPMLVIDGRLHPRLAKAKTSEKTRDGVCVQGGSLVLFAISEGPVPFDTFERLFRDGLECRNALFLDGGSAPALYSPAAPGSGNLLVGLGPMIAVYERSGP